MYNSNDKSTVYIRTTLDVGFRQILKMTLTQTDHMGNSMSQTMDFDIVVCGNEAWNTPAGPLKWIYDAAAGTRTIARFSGTDNVSQHFSLQPAGPTTHSNCCQYAVFESYSDSACANRFDSWDIFTHTTHSLNWETGNGNTITFNGATPFAVKTFYIRSFSHGLSPSGCVEVNIENCGWENNMLVDNSEVTYLYYVNQGGGTMIPSKISDFFKTNSVNCKVKHWDLWWRDTWSGYNSWVIILDTANDQLKILTTVPYIHQVDIRGWGANTADQPRKKINAIVCNNPVAISGTT